MHSCCIIVDDREVLTEGKLLLLACENGSLQGFGLHSRKKASVIRDFFKYLCWLTPVVGQLKSHFL